MIADQILACLDKVRQTSPNSWMALCPVHDEKTPSLSITEDNNTVLIHCFGCGANGKDVCEHFGFSPFILFGDDFQPGNSMPKVPAPDIVRCLKADSMFLYFCAKEVLAGNALSTGDMDKLQRVTTRFFAAAEAGNL